MAGKSDTFRAGPAAEVVLPRSVCLRYYAFEGEDIDEALAEPAGHGVAVVPLRMTAPGCVTVSLPFPKCDTAKCRASSCAFRMPGLFHPPHP